MKPILRSMISLVFLIIGAVTIVHDVLAAEQTAMRSVRGFFLIGGNADSTLHDFAELAGGSKARIAIITYADNKPEEAADSIQNAFSAANVRDTTIIAADSKVDPKLPDNADAVYIVGGNESRLMRRIKEPLRTQLANFKGLIGMNSAGAMAAVPVMISGGLEQGVIRAGQLKVADGLALLSGLAIDSHVGQRNRDARCAATLGAIPGVQMCIGLDEDTAVYIAGNKATVYGAGHVRLFRPGPSFTTTLQSSPKNTVASVHNVLVSYLKAGESFDIPTDAGSK